MSFGRVCPNCKCDECREVRCQVVIKCSSSMPVFSTPYEETRKKVISLVQNMSTEVISKPFVFVDNTNCYLFVNFTRNTYAQSFCDLIHKCGEAVFGGQILECYVGRAAIQKPGSSTSYMFVGTNKASNTNSNTQQQHQKPYKSTSSSSSSEKKQVRKRVRSDDDEDGDRYAVDVNGSSSDRKHRVQKSLSSSSISSSFYHKEVNKPLLPSTPEVEERVYDDY